MQVLPYLNRLFIWMLHGYVCGFYHKARFYIASAVIVLVTWVQRTATRIYVHYIFFKEDLSSPCSFWVHAVYLDWNIHNKDNLVQELNKSSFDLYYIWCDRMQVLPYLNRLFIWMLHVCVQARAHMFYHKARFYIASAVIVVVTWV